MRTLARLLGMLAALSLPAAGGQALDERGRAHRWARGALLGERRSALPATVGLEVIRQDHGQFRRCRSVLDTPLRLGKKRYAHGLGTHSVSEIIVRLPGPGRRFEAEAGVDNNHDTRGQKGSVVFVVAANGKEMFRSGVRRGSDPPLPVRVELEGAREFTLRVLDAGDGPSWDQADWAEARVMLANDEQVWLDGMAAVVRGRGLSTEIPFSFVYGGKPSAEVLAAWKRTHEKRPADGGRERHVVTHADHARPFTLGSYATQ